METTDQGSTVQLAGSSQLFMGSIIDALLLILLYSPLFILIQYFLFPFKHVPYYTWLDREDQNPFIIEFISKNGVPVFFNILALTIVSILLFAIIPTLVSPGQTIGRVVSRSKLVRSNGSPASAGVLLKRHLLYFLPGVAFLFPLFLPITILASCALFVAVPVNLLMIFADEKRQTLFDKFADTVAIKV